MKKLTEPTGTIDFAPTHIQYEAWKYLTDDVTRILLFGGAAGAGKSYLACAYVVFQCFQYPGVVGGMTRSRLIDFQKSTLITLMKVLNQFHCKENENYHFDRKSNIITFWNDSKIMIFDSETKPSDPEFEKIGSTEFTFCVIDEASQTSKKAFNIIQTRIRYKHSEYNLIPKLLVVTNPTLNFIKSDIYKPYVDGTLPEHINVVLGLVSDNPHIDKSYAENLESLDGAVRARLLYGDWDYSNMDDSIFESDALVNMFHNSFFNDELNSKLKYLTCDVASTGGDETVICLWEGLDCFYIEKMAKKTIPQIYERIKVLMKEHLIKVTNVVVDKSGVGTGLFDLLKGCIGFVANERPKNAIYGMLKDELWYKFAEAVNSSKIKISESKYRDDIVQELGLHVMWNYDKDNTKTQIIPKDKVKQKLGHSPDIADALVMRMIFNVKSVGFKFSFVDT